MAGSLSTLVTAAFDASNATSYSIPSATYTSGRIYIITARNRRTTAAAAQPTLSGGTISWSKQIDLGYAGGDERLSAWVGICSSTETNGITIDMGGATQVNCTYHVAEGTGFVTSSIAALVLQPKTLGDSSSSTPSLAFDSAFSSANNCTYSVADYNRTNAASIASDTNLSSLANVAPSGLEVGHMAVAWKASEEATVDWTKGDTVVSGHGIMELVITVAATAVKDLIGAGMIPYAR